MEESLSESFSEEIFKICFQSTIANLNKNIDNNSDQEMALYRCYNLFKKSNTLVTAKFTQIATEKAQTQNK
jgi:hypothetical protein